MTLKNKNWVGWNAKIKKKKVSDTLDLTLKLFLEGNSITKISSIRELKKETIEGHIIRLITKSIISIDDVINEKNKIVIGSFINGNNSKSLSDIKNNLSDEITYFQIKAVIANLNKNPLRIKK